MYEKLIKEAEKENIEVVEMKLSKRIKGLYYNNIIAVNDSLTTSKEKACVLCEELGHYHTSTGDILDQSDINNRKQERIARAWGYRKLVGIIDLIDAYKQGITNRFELAEYLDVTEEFIEECLKYYREKYGLFYEIDEYVVYFEPLGVFKRLF